MADHRIAQYARVVFQPRWIALALFVVGFTALCWSVLAPWQLGKNVTTSHRNQQIADSVNAAPVPAAQLLRGVTTVGSTLEWRKVTITGHYLDDKEVVARLRTWDGDPAYEILTPFAASDGTDYLVDRGFVKTASGDTVPAYDAAPTGTVTLVARIRKSEGTGAGRGVREEAGHLQAGSIDPDTVGHAVGLDLAPGYLNLSDSQPGGLGTVPLPQLDAGPYLSYGLQWLAFGIMAPGALGYFIFSEVKRRREERAVMAAAEGSGAPEPSADGDGAGSVPAEPVREVTPEEARAARLADRYGRRG
ncbi:SURF1 family cytochrome oxidase biogenesis protein [Tsukamurella soli]|uniref:SURF1-like protein n=1 Tax=Tsukamurella soli TaxID=644556 RepID=A0ABP8JQN1_9ACTN